MINLQPCMNYDGILDPKEHAERVEEITFRMEVSVHARRCPPEQPMNLMPRVPSTACCFSYVIF